VHTAGLIGARFAQGLIDLAPIDVGGTGRNADCYRRKPCD
jgi:hypothetical protein